MCRFTFLIHACGHYSSPAPTQCAIYHNYYSSDSVLDLASTLIPSAHECPFAQGHARISSAKCGKCAAGGRFNLPLDTTCGGAGGNGANTSSAPSSSSSSSTYSNEKALALLQAAPPRAQHKPLPPAPPTDAVMVRRVMGWEGWAKMNMWRKKIMRGGFGGEKVRRKVVRSSITDLHSSVGYIGI